MELFKEPGFKDPLTFLQTERSRQPNISSLMNSLEKRYRGSSLYDFAESIATVVEPIDRSMGVDQTYPYGLAFLSGALLGVHVVKHCTPKKVQDTVSILRYAVTIDETDKQQSIFNIASQLVDDSNEGMELVPEVGELIDWWGEQITPDIRHQVFVKRGFGMMICMVNNANDIVISQELELGSKNGAVDWDREFGKLLGNG